MAHNQTPKNNHLKKTTLPRFGHPILSSHLKSALEAGEELDKEVNALRHKIQDQNKELDVLRGENRQLKEAADKLLYKPTMPAMPTPHPFDMNNDKIFQELSDLKRLVSLWVSYLPDCKKFARTWMQANNFLKLMRARCLPLGVLRLNNVKMEEKAFLTFATCSLIWTNFFAPYLPGADPQDRFVLNKLWQGISRMSDTKDSKSIKQWKSDTLRALALSTMYSDQSKTTTGRLTGFVRTVLDILTFDNHDAITKAMSYFYNQIAPLAERVATAIQCRPEEYVWNWSYEDRTIYAGDTKRFEILCIERKGEAVENNKERPADDDAIGYSLLPSFLFPSLSRVQEDGQDAVIVSKGWVAMVPLSTEELDSKEAGNAPE